MRDGVVWGAVFRTLEIRKSRAQIQPSVTKQGASGRKESNREIGISALITGGKKVRERFKFKQKGAITGVDVNSR